MKSRRNMSDLFRQSEGQLDRSPSPQSWQRLEERLEQRRRRHRIHRLRPYAMAAGLLILLAFSFVIAISINDQPAAYEAADYSLAQASPQALEELAPASATTEGQTATLEAIVYSNRLHDPSRQVSVMEGEVEKKLMVRNPANR